MKNKIYILVAGIFVFASIHSVAASTHINDSRDDNAMYDTWPSDSDYCQENNHHDYFNENRNRNCYRQSNMHDRKSHCNNQNHAYR